MRLVGRGGRAGGDDPPSVMLYPPVRVAAARVLAGSSRCEGAMLQPPLPSGLSSSTASGATGVGTRLGVCLQCTAAVAIAVAAVLSM